MSALSEYKQNLEFVKQLYSILAADYTKRAEGKASPYTTDQLLSYINGLTNAKSNLDIVVKKLAPRPRVRTAIAVPKLPTITSQSASPDFPDIPASPPRFAAQSATPAFSAVRSASPSRSAARTASPARSAARTAQPGRREITALYYAGNLEAAVFVIEKREDGVYVNGNKLQTASDQELLNLIPTGFADQQRLEMLALLTTSIPVVYREGVLPGVISSKDGEISITM